MHPDQHTPDSHRYRSPDSNQKRKATSDAAENNPSPSAPESEGKRTHEDGGEYVGRMMDDDLKNQPLDDGESA